MNDTIKPVLENLFGGSRAGGAVVFDWRLVTRHGKPFLLLPADPDAARTGLQLYSAQRYRAKVWRRVLPALLRTPAAQFFPALRFEASAESEFLQFLARLGGVPAERVSIGAIKFSEFGERSRVVLLLCDENGRPAHVVKAGLNEAGRAATIREEDFLARLPASKLGCIRMTGRFSSENLAAFATEYFPGDSPFDDAGLEHLFHDWLDTAETVPLAALAGWREIGLAVGAQHAEAWRRIEAGLADTRVHPALYHGDFAPWNVRVVSARNLQVFDWERGSLRGVPGWDWFHFTVQTTILARRQPAERAAAEVELMLNSPRFRKYAEAAGIAGCARPLLLAYLLHHAWVTKPLEGGRICRELFSLLLNHWTGDTALPAAPAAEPAVSARSAREQIAAAFRQWNNLFWEPSLNSPGRYSVLLELRRGWIYLLLCAGLVAGIATIQYHANTHIMFLPFMALVCALLAWKTGRRLAVPFAAATSLVSPLVVACMETGFRNPAVMTWNIVMRFIILQLCVLFTDRLHKQRALAHHRAPADETAPGLLQNWAVAGLCFLVLAAVTAADYATDPLLTFLPLYILPGMMFALVFGLRRGVVFALLAVGASSWVEFATTKAIHYTPAEIFFWNLPMRFGILLLVLFLQDRIRRENILFSTMRPAG
jgi:hypothetical protein